MQITKNTLEDVKNGKKIEWQKYKINSLSLSDSYLRIAETRNTKFYRDYFINKAIRVNECGTILTFKKFIDFSLKLHSANFCKVRLCPMCSW